MTESTKHPDRDDPKMSSEDYEHLLDHYQFHQQEITMGKILKGRVIKRTPTHVLVDIGFKTEGAIPVEEFSDTKALAELRPGSEVEAMLEKTDVKDGYLILSKRRADGVRAIDLLEKAFAQNTAVAGKVVDRTRGGFAVDVGIPAFLPESHADIRPVKDPASLIGQTLKFRVMKFDRKSENAVLSRRLLLQDEREKRKRRVFDHLAKGQKLPGHVRSLTNFGAFVDIGGVEGLLHVSDMSWGKIGHPSELLKAGQEIEVVVLDFNEKDERISLGLKQLTPDPWANIAEKYQAGQKITGKVSSLTDFGAFVELEKGVEGLVHISDLTWSRKLVHPKKILSPGQEVVVTILDVNPTTKRISLGLKQASPHPLDVFKQKHGVGSRIKGPVTSLTDFGAFVEIEKGIEGLVHISDITWEKAKHPSEKLRVGQEVEALVLAIDVERQKVSLGIKQLEGDIWEDFFSRQQVGDIVKVKIVRITDFGVFVEIVPGIEGVVFTSELDEKKIEKPSDEFAVGDERNAKIIRLNPKAKKISLSFKQAQFDLQKQEFQKFMDSQDDRMTLGDIMKDQLKNLAALKRGTKKEDSRDKS
ncbi:MAG TPA: 30S ribosomal protein S1 [Terriglobales bacterium]|nr:30S ribosomal protein S1 [Terriglobales bacterium]